MHRQGSQGDLRADRVTRQTSSRTLGHSQASLSCGGGEAGSEGGDASLRESPTALSLYPPRAGAVPGGEAGAGGQAAGWLGGLRGGPAAAR